MNIKVNKIITNLKENYTKNDELQNHLKDRELKIKEYIDKSILDSKKEFETKLNDVNSKVIHKINALDNKLSTENNEIKSNMNKLNDKLNQFIKDTNESIKYIKDTVMLPKNPNKNKHGSKCIVDENSNE